MDQWGVVGRLVCLEELHDLLMEEESSLREALAGKLRGVVKVGTKLRQGTVGVEATRYLLAHHQKAFLVAYFGYCYSEGVKDCKLVVGFMPYLFHFHPLDQKVP
jgi:hypothetical protein